MRIILRADYTVCRDGIRQEQFTAGQEVQMPEHIARVLLEDGRAAVPVAEKAEKGAPENKGGENLGPGRSKRRS